MTEKGFTPDPLAATMEISATLIGTLCLESMTLGHLLSTQQIMMIAKIIGTLTQNRVKTGKLKRWKAEKIMKMG